MNRSEFTANLELQPKDVPSWQRPAPVRAIPTRTSWFQRIISRIFDK